MSFQSDFFCFLSFAPQLPMPVFVLNACEHRRAPDGAWTSSRLDRPDFQALKVLPESRRKPAEGLKRLNCNCKPSMIWFSAQLSQKSLSLSSLDSDGLNCTVKSSIMFFLPHHNDYTKAHSCFSFLPFGNEQMFAVKTAYFEKVVFNNTRRDSRLAIRSATAIYSAKPSSGWEILAARMRSDAIRNAFKWLRK